MKVKNQKGFAEIGAIFALLAIGAAIGVVNFSPKPVVRERVVVVEKPVTIEVVKEMPCPIQEKAWWEIWK